MVCGNMTADSEMGWVKPQWEECISAWSTLVRSVGLSDCETVTVTDCGLFLLMIGLCLVQFLGNTRSIIKQELSGAD